ncbi:MAG: hypothetical protein LLF94_11750 [Chlamydiales bacterium]|nr:hypothetical protein [Chlamydiales bacterium]
MIVVDNILHHNNIPKQIDPIDEAAKTGIKGIKVTKKVSKVFKGVVNVVELFEKIPYAVEETLVAIKTFKIIGGMLAIPKLVKSAGKVKKAKGPEAQFMITYKIVKCFKKIIVGIETTIYYFAKLKIVTKAALKWTEFTDKIFAPLTFISSGLTAYEFGKKVKALRSFRSELSLAKKGAHTPHEKAVKTNAHLLTQIKTLKKMKVISKNCPLKDRLKDIGNRLEIHDPKAIEDAKHLRRSLNNRITERVAAAAIETALEAVDLTSTLLDIAYPKVAAIDTGLTITSLATTLLGITNKAYTQYIPTGDIMSDEKPMLLTRVYKTVRSGHKALLNTVKRFGNRASAAA